MEERRKHPDNCLMQEEWGMIKQYMKATTEETAIFREDLKATLKERFDTLTAQIVEEGRKRDAHMTTIDDRLYKHKAEFIVATDAVDGRVTRLKDTIGRITFWVVCSIITFSVAWGALSTTVVRNTDIIKELQEKSYGYRDTKVVTDGEHNRV